MTAHDGPGGRRGSAERSAASGATDDRRGVTPVVGVVLLVGITILLSVSVAAFVYSTGTAQLETTPQVVLDFEYDPGGPRSPDALVVTHLEGDEVSSDRLAVDVRNARYRDERYGYELDAVRNESVPYVRTDAVAAGDSIVVSTDAFDRGVGVGMVGEQDFDLSRARVCVLWTGEGDRSDTLGCWGGPDTSRLVE